MPKTLTREKARQIAARVWCDPEMAHVVMDIVAAEKIADILLDVVKAQE